MKRMVAVAVVAFLAGCSNAPIAGFMDSCFPCKPANPRPPDRPPLTLPPGDPLPPSIGGPIGPPGSPPNPLVPSPAPIGPPAGVPGVTP